MNKLMEELASMFQGTFRVRVQWRLSTRHRPFNAAYTIPPYELVFDRQLRPEIFLALPRTWLWMRRRFCCTLTLWKDKSQSSWLCVSSQLLSARFHGCRQACQTATGNVCSIPQHPICSQAALQQQLHMPSSHFLEAELPSRRDQCSCPH